MYFVHTVQYIVHTYSEEQRAKKIFIHAKFWVWNWVWEFSKGLAIACWLLLLWVVRDERERRLSSWSCWIVPHAFASYLLFLMDDVQVPLNQFAHFGKPKSYTECLAQRFCIFSIYCLVVESRLCLHTTFNIFYILYCMMKLWYMLYTYMHLFTCNM